MVSFRFHLLSLTAVFLALAVGIAIGATVVDQATVDALQKRLNTVEANVARTERENTKLSTDANEWRRFADQAGDELINGRLTQVPVLLIGVRGTDHAALDRFKQSLGKAGAVLEGTVWFTSKLKLEKAEDVTDLASILGVPNGRPDELRRALVNRVAASWSGSGEGNPLPLLLNAAFAEFEPPTALKVDPATVPRPETRFVIASDATPDVGNEQLAVAFAVQLSKSFPSRVLAVEPAGAFFVGPLRVNEQAAAQLSTVDNLADFRGRMAAVLALQDLGRAKVGHYGDEARASRLVPEPAS
jgi:hypothetical protein